MAAEVETWWVLPAGLICLAALLLLLLLLLAKKNHPTPKDLTLSTSGEIGKPNSNTQRRLVLEILMSSGRTTSFRLKLEADAANFTALTNLASSLQSTAKGCPCDRSGVEEEEEEEEEAGAPGHPEVPHKDDTVPSHVTVSGIENNVPDAEAEGNYGGLQVEAEEGNYGGLQAEAKMSGDDVAALHGTGCESDWADGRAEKKRRRRRRRRKKKVAANGEFVTGRGGEEEEEGELGCTCGKWKGGDCHEGSCSYPFTSSGRGSVMQRKIKQHYDELIHSNTAGPLTLAQVGRFTNCLVEAKAALLQKSETIQRKFTIAKSLLVKADKSSFDRLCGQIYRLETEQKRLEEDTKVYNRLQEQLKLSPSYQKMLEYGHGHFQSHLNTGQLLEKSEAEDAEISFEELLAQEKKDSFWKKHGHFRSSMPVSF